MFGRSAFIYTVIIDALKTIIPLLIASLLLDSSAVLLGCIALAILIGHIWPVQLQFHGGKGVVVYLAVALALAPITLIVVGLCLLIGLSIKKNFTVVGLLALSTIPVILVILAKLLLAGLFLVMLIIIILVHRKKD